LIELNIRKSINYFNNLRAFILNFLGQQCNTTVREFWHDKPKIGFRYAFRSPRTCANSQHVDHLNSITRPLSRPNHNQIIPTPKLIRIGHFRALPLEKWLKDIVGRKFEIFTCRMQPALDNTPDVLTRGK